MEKEYKRKARQFQIDFFKNEVVNTDKPEYRPETDQYGIFENEEDIKRGLIFYEGYRSEILNELAKPNVKFSGQMKCHTLRSEHIPWNVFFPMTLDENQNIVIPIFNEILEKKTGIKDLIQSIDLTSQDNRERGIRIEYAPEPIEFYLNDKTSFDTYIAFKTKDGKKGGIGIEVKYTEEGYPMGKLEGKRLSDEEHQSLYYSVMNVSHYFCTDTANAKSAKTESWKELINNDLRQIWRNHLLGASMIQQGDIQYFLSLHLYPKGNLHFSGNGNKDGAINEYQKYLTEKGNTTWEALTFEDLFTMMAKYAESEGTTKWINYLQRRYLF